MKRLYKYTIILLTGVLLMLSLTGCSLFGDRDNSTKFIDRTIPVIADAFRSGDANEVCSLLENSTDYTRSELERFFDDCGNISKIYLDYGGFAHEKGVHDGEKYESINTLNGYILADNGIYIFWVNYTQYNKKDIKIHNLWIISGKTEAIENQDWKNKYHFEKGTEFIYADYYDDYFSGEYRLIWGEILQWNENSAVLEEDDFDKDDLKSISLDAIVSKYGQYGAEYDTVNGYHTIFYKTSEKGKYTQIFLDDDDIADEVQSTDEIGYGITGIKEIK